LLLQLAREWKRRMAKRDAYLMPRVEIAELASDPAELRTENADKQGRNRLQNNA
jgi:hypothetical protein